MSRPPLPPFDAVSAAAKVQAAEDAWNTRDPEKVAALQAAGVTVTERVPHQLPENPHNARYLATKRDRSGHLLI